MKMLRTKRVGASKGIPVDGGTTGGFVVRAGPGLKNTLKFNLKRKGDRLYPVPCAVCGSARKLLGIRNSPAVQNAVKTHPGWPIEGFDRDTAKKEFEALLAGRAAG